MAARAPAKSARNSSASAAWKLYSFRAPEIERIGRTRASAPYEFGVKVSITAANARVSGGRVVLYAKVLPGKPVRKGRKPLALLVAAGSRSRDPTCPNSFARGACVGLNPIHQNRGWAVRRTARPVTAPRSTRSWIASASAKGRMSVTSGHTSPRATRSQVSRILVRVT